jgi:hypothetical protein
LVAIAAHQVIEQVLYTVIHGSNFLSGQTDILNGLIGSELGAL